MLQGNFYLKKDYNTSFIIKKRLFIFIKMNLFYLVLLCCHGTAPSLLK